VTARATVDVASAPSTGSSVRLSAKRIATAMAPNSAAEAHASRTASTQAVL